MSGLLDNLDLGSHLGIGCGLWWYIVLSKLYACWRGL